MRWWASPPVTAVILALSVAAYVVASALGREPFRMIDLRVYYEGARHLLDDTTLYTFRSSALGLPFTYPPFAALVLGAVAWLPWTACRVVWQVASLAALVVICHRSLVLADDAASPRSASRTRALTMLTTAAALWTEPVRSTLVYGQINLFLVAGLLAGLAARRSWVAGASVGVAAAVKLIPGITALYYLLAGRLRAVVATVATFVLAVAVSAAVAPRLTWQFFTETVFDPSRAGGIGAVNNQSLRGALARVLGHDSGTVWLVAAAAVLVAGVLVARVCLRVGDRLGAFLVVQLIGLLVSPISWNHHWVWVLPLLAWVFAGPRRPGLVAAVGAVWGIAVLSFVVSVQIADETLNGAGTSTGWGLWAKGVYPVLGIVTVLAIGYAHRGRPAVPAPAPAVSADAR